LALARGLTEAMHGTLQPEDTPGGGLTMVVSMPAAAPRADEAPVPGSRERSAAETGERE
jgi:two-component system sensor histidine kinase KdpD